MWKVFAARRQAKGLALLVGLLASVLAYTDIAAAEPQEEQRAYVFLPHAIPAHHLAAALRKDDAFSHLSITCFSRQSEFIAAQKDRPADILITPGCGADSFPTYTRTLVFAKGDLTHFKYSVIALDKAVTMVRVRSVGAVDELGRSGTVRHVNKLLGREDIALRRVTKPDDLIPMLVLGNADAAVVHPDALARLQKRYKVPVTKIGESGEAGNVELLVAPGCTFDAKAFTSRIGPKALKAIGEYTGVKIKQLKEE